MWQGLHSPVTYLNEGILMAKDFYGVLGVSRDASDSEIKSAYKRKVIKFHPDRMVGHPAADIKKSEDKIKEINEAYTVLSNKQKKQAFDQFGDQNATGSSPFSDGFGQGGFPDLNDILNSFFSGGSSGGHHTNFQGSDLGYTATLSLKEAAFGVEKEVSIGKKESCDSCHGSGAKSGSRPSTCSTCRGKGKVTLQQGFMAIQQLCPSCHGEGAVMSNPCLKCQGKGCYQQKCKIKIRIPAGVDTGDRMRVAGKGDAGVRGAPSGDLYISISVSQHSFFERDGNDLHCSVPISFYQACIGGEINVATLDSLVKLKIPHETQSGSSLRLRGLGIKSVKTGRTGDIICHILIETPIKLTTIQKDTLKEFNTSIQKNQQQQPKTMSFFEKIKKIIS